MTTKFWTDDSTKVDRQYFSNTAVKVKEYTAPKTWWENYLEKATGISVKDQRKRVANYQKRQEQLYHTAKSHGMTYEQAYNTIKNIYMRHMGKEYRELVNKGSDVAYDIPVDILVNWHGLSNEEKRSIRDASKAIAELEAKYPGIQSTARKMNGNIRFAPPVSAKNSFNTIV